MVSLLPGQLAWADGAKDFKLRPVQETSSVPGTPLSPDTSTPLSDTDKNPWTPPKVAWPKAGESEVTLDDGGKAAVKTAALGRTATAHKPAGNLPVKVAPAAGGEAGGKQAKPATRVRRAAAAKNGEDAPQRPAKVKVRLADREATQRAGVDGVLLSVSRSDGATTSGRASVQLDYNAFRDAYGANWGARLRLVQLPACVLDTPEKAECRTATPLRTDNDSESGTVTAEVDVPAGPEDAGGKAPQMRTMSVRSAAATVLAASAAPSGGEGDFSATPLSPSGSWKAGGNAGAFSWSYPMEVPSVPGPLKPKLGLSYSSAAIDGRTASSNNQASWVGDGWGLDMGFVERQYMACKDDNGKGSNAPKEAGDLCWKSENAMLSLGGTNTALVKDGKTGEWKPQADDGSRIEHLTGSAADTGNGDDDNEYWKVTTTDGTQYFFGKNRLPGWSEGKAETKSANTVPVFGNHEGEPGHKDAFKDSVQDQAWRWNLDYVVDVHGNAMAFFYEQETNAYAKNSGGTHTSKPKADATYVRGGQLARIEYGHRAGKVYDAQPAAKVLFGTADRCLATECAFDKKHAENWPDTPFDQSCEKGKECMNGSPTFWSKKRLSTVTTQARKGDGYQDVDTWTLTHQFPGVGDAGGPSLWLSTITRTGKAGGTALSMPKADFGGTLMPNRVDSNEGRPPMNKYRLTRISSETGSDTLIDYSAPECKAGKTPDPASNTGRCYPMFWTPTAAVDPVKDWFHKYVVTKVTENDKVAGAEPKTTAYEYLDGIAWAKDTNEFTLAKHRTYSDYRGYGKVRTRTGTSNKTLSEAVFLRGIEGAKVTDSSGATTTDAEQYAGVTLETATYDKDGGKVSASTLNRPWSKETGTQTRAGTTDLVARQVGTKEELSRTLLSDGKWRTTKSTNEFNDHGQIVSTSDEGDTAVEGDEMCTRTTFAADEKNWLLSYPATLQRTDATCGTPANADNTLNEVHTAYDGKAHGQAPEPGGGNPTKVDELDRFDGGKPVFVTTSVVAYDATGRTVEETNAAGRKTRTDYTPSSGAQPTKVTTTDPKGYVKSAEMDGLRGLTIKANDANGRSTIQRYDALGRLTAAWKPGRAESEPADVQFSYNVRRDGPTVVTSKTLLENGKYRTALTIYDGLLRARQKQTDAHGGKGRIVSDTLYDSHGRQYKTNAEYYNEGATAPVVLSVADNKVPQQTVTEYDGQGRTTASVTKSLNVEQWRTTTSYGGNWTATVPPKGGTAKLTLVNAHDKPVEVRQYKNGKPELGADAATYESLKYTYDSADRLTKLVDTVGNTWTAEYDLRGHRTKSTDPDKGTVTTTYTPDGQVATTKDARGQTLATTYDELGRRTSVRKDSDKGDKLAEWNYDTLDGGKGLLGSSVRYEKGNAYSVSVTGYDVAGRATGSTVTVPEAEGKLAGSYTFTSSYTPNTGLAATTSYPAGGGLAAETVRHGYTEFGLPTSLSGNGKVYSTGNQYSPTGELLQTVLGDVGHRAVQTYVYQPATRRLDTVTNDREANGPQTLDHKIYTYDPAGNITRIRNDRDDKKSTDTQCYTYDFAQRLTDAWTAADDCAAQPADGTAPKVGGVDPYWHSYTYDAIGNRTTETRHDPAGDNAKDTQRKYTYPKPGQPLPHAMSTVGISGPGARDDSFEYDKAGNTTRRVTAEGDQKLTWDAEGRMASSTIDGKTSTFLYDADGKRLLRRDPGAVTLYLDSQELKLDTKTDKVSGKRFYTVKNSTVVASSDGTLSFLLSDHHGTPELTIDAQSMQYSRRNSGPFGTARGPQPATDAWPSEHGFVGGTKDTSTGLTHVGAREYDAENGKFVSGDPLLNTDNPQQVNGYAYANSNPVTNSDPSGKYSMGDWGFDLGLSVVFLAENTAGGAPLHEYSSWSKKRRSSYHSASRQMWDDGPKGTQTGRFNVGKGKDRGIVMVRYFIHTREAMKVAGPFMSGILLGDDRDFSDDPDQAYRMVVFWDTASGDVVFKVAPSHLNPDNLAVAPLYGGNMTFPRRMDANPLVIDDSDNWFHEFATSELTRVGINVLQKRDSNSEMLNLGVHGVQPVAPAGAVDNNLSIAANGSTVSVRREGNSYPDMEAVQYRRNSEPKTIARDHMNGEYGFSALFEWDNVDRSWVNNRCISGCD
ncbi:RHS repeat-associated core domain-containing protein [Streptomyces sp. NPDC007100]|uniref:RHS repeat domain-containing protein n=1 Tax=Streptomyces sp. NPDC007100 TaxID=3155602 RepID=UPI0033FDFB14